MLLYLTYIILGFQVSNQFFSGLLLCIRHSLFYIIITFEAYADRIRITTGSMCALCMIRPAALRISLQTAFRES